MVLLKASRENTEAVADPESFAGRDLLRATFTHSHPKILTKTVKTGSSPWPIPKVLGPKFGSVFFLRILSQSWTFITKDEVPRWGGWKSQSVIITWNTAKSTKAILKLFYNSLKQLVGIPLHAVLLVVSMFALRHLFPNKERKKRLQSSLKANHQLKALSSCR